MTSSISRSLMAVIAVCGIRLCVAQSPADVTAIGAEEAEAVHVEGTLLRPESPCEHETLEAAWGNYQAALKAASGVMRERVEELFESATAKGDLDEAEKWQAVVEKFGVAGILPRQPELKAAVVAMESQLKKAEKELLAAYSDAIKSLTMEKKLDDAKAVRDEREAVLKTRVGLPSLNASRSGSVKLKREVASRQIQADGWQDITGEMLGGIRRGNVIAIRPDGERAASGRSYAPPLEIEYVCATSKNNLRLGFTCSEIIFNWEVNQSELRIGGGPADGQHVRDAGAITPGQFVTIRQVVLPDGMTLFVDGVIRASWKGDFSRVRDLIEVFGTDSEVQLKSVRVRRPTE